MDSMYSTYKMMSNCTNSYYLDKTLEELVDDYRALQQDITVAKKKEQNKVIAAMFVKVFPMILKIQSKYYSLTNEQKVDHAIFHLIRSIKYYNNRNVKFSSFFHTHLTNQMKTLLTTQNNNKNAVFQNIVADNDLQFNRYIHNEIDSKSFDYQERTLINDIKTSSHLSQEEKEFCLCYLMGYNKMQQISEKMQLNKRVTNPINSKNIQNEQDSEKQSKYEIRQVRKIKKSLKEKYKKYKNDLFG